MDERPATLTVRGPHGERAAVLELTKPRLSVGRVAPGSQPDVRLDPDPQRWVSRLHCFLDNEDGSWWIIDNGTSNGTFLRRGDEFGRLQGRTRLDDGDVICILGDVTASGPQYWELAFSDPFGTRRARLPLPPSPACVHYDWTQAKLYRCVAGRRVEIPDLSPKVHELIRFLVKRSEASGGSPIACTHDELIAAIWGEPREWPRYKTYTRENLRELVSEVRQRIEPNPRSPVLLEAIPGIGYRLNVCPPPQSADT